MATYLKTDDEISLMHESGQLAKRVLEFIAPYVQPGISTLELNDLCHHFILDHKAIPAPLNYRGFPKSICTSINSVVCHGIPREDEKLCDGDIINVDITTILKGFHGDTSRTFYVGDKVPGRAKRLVECSEQSLMLGIETVKNGAERIGDIGSAIQEFVEAKNYSVVREFVGHGIGRQFHEDPQVPHYGKSGSGARILEGLVFTIEPMINEGHWRTRVLKDGWTAVTVDGKLSAQFEHTLAINSRGDVMVLTG